MATSQLDRSGSLTPAELADRLDGRPLQDGRWAARCPAHDDRNASLSIGTGDDGRVLLHCHAGCSVQDVCWKLGITQRALFPRGAPPASRGRSRDWFPVAVSLAKNLDDAGREALAAELGLPVEALAAVPHLGRGADAGGGYWAFPEVRVTPDGDGIDVSGVVRSYLGTGEKKALAGSKRGLAVPFDWRRHDGPVLSPEGWSDVLALAHAGVSCVGRPSAGGGAADLAAFLQRVGGEGTTGTAGTISPRPDRRAIVILAENDRDEEAGRWPGRDGALSVARALAARLGRPVGVAFPPGGAKDARTWFTAELPADADPAAWRAAGRRFLAHVERDVQWVEPGGPPGAAHEGESGDLPRRDDRRAVLVEPTDVAGTADQLQALLQGSPDVYAAGGQLVRLRRVSEFDGSGRLVHVHQTEGLDPVVAADLLSQRATFHREKGDNFVGCRPPEDGVAAALSRDPAPGVRHLRGVVNTPLLLPDGRLVRRPGFDPETGWFVDPGDLRLPPLPERPTRGDAASAVATLLDLVAEFDWAADADRAAWLAFVLTLCCRAAVDGCAPAFAFSAPTPGSGKSLLVRVASLVALGYEPGMKTLPTLNRGRDGAEVDEEELRKLLYAVALAGRPLVVFDNVRSGVALGGAALDGALTAAQVGGRKLGVSVERDLPWRAVIAATGNHLTVAGDTTRRVVYAQVVPAVERPAERGDYRIADLPGHVRRHRGGLLAAAITIVRAYILAGCPAQGLRNYGSFEGWDRAIRGAVHWATGHDPLGARSGMPTEDAADSVAELYAALAEVPGMAHGRTAREILAAVKAARGSPALADLAALVAEWAGPGEDLPSERSLGMRLRARKDRVAGGLRLRSRDRDNTKVWVLEKLTPGRDEVK